VDHWDGGCSPGLVDGHWSQVVLVKVSLRDVGLVDEAEIDGLTDSEAEASPENKDQGDHWHVEVDHLLEFFWRHVLDLVLQLVQELVDVFLSLSLLVSVVLSVFRNERVVDLLSDSSKSFEHVHWSLFLLEGGWE
jgi:hypothetical protein